MEIDRSPRNSACEDDHQRFLGEHLKTITTNLWVQTIPTNLLVSITDERDMNSRRLRSVSHQSTNSVHTTHIYIEDLSHGMTIGARFHVNKQK